MKKILQICFDCQVVERLLLPDELANYMRFGKHLQWVDQLATCQVHVGETLYINKVDCGPHLQVVGEMDEKSREL